ncbi:3-hydroxybutyrate dehydrogenase [Permianibacter sp. IMCC34836]|nr:3-hydroxybutyrate dehydrogenase [Permianibacter fluminis]
MALRILITGAGSGIGEGIARLLAATGHLIIATDVSLEAVQALASSLPAGQVKPYRLDVTHADDVATLLQAEPHIDVLINNAGIQHVARLESFPMERWALLIDIMLTGATRMTQAVLPGMRERGFGRIVNIGSIHSLVASPFKSAYVAAKHGLLGFSKVVALETADTDITINTVCSTYVKTPLVDKQIAATAAEYNMSAEQVVSEVMLKPMPKGVFISLEELAGICEFLISPVARNITGQTITVDGGWTAR